MTFFLRKFFAKFLVGLMALAATWVFYALTPTENLEKLHKVTTDHWR